MKRTNCITKRGTEELTILKGSTKEGQRYINTARYIAGRTLYDVYNSFSKAKDDAYDWCMRRMEDFDGDNFHITGANCNFFTVAFEGEIKYIDPKTGEVTDEEVVVVETASSEYVVLVNR